MEKIINDKHSNTTYDEEEISLREIFDVIIEGKWVIVSLSAFASIIGVIYSLSLPDIYESKALLVPVNSSSSISSSLQGFSGLAGLAGISLPSSGAESVNEKAIQKLVSLSFFENNVMSGIFLPDLMALQSWDYKTNTLNYDEDIYNKNSNAWVRDYSYPNKQIPSIQESFRVFQNEHINISTNKKTGFVSLLVRHKSPYVAKKWSELLIREINIFYRQQDKLESKKAVSYLNEQIALTSLSEVKQVMAELLQNEIQKLTLIEANQSYVFDYIDPPAVMEQKSEPNRAFICILSSLLGGLLSIFIVLIKHYIPREKTF